MKILVLGMRCHGGHSAGMMDLTRPEGQRQLLGFARDLFAAVATGAEPAHLHEPACASADCRAATR